MSSYRSRMSAMKNNATDGSEYSGGIPIPGVIIGHLECEYCNTEILAVWDEHNKNAWWPYLGNQARKPKTYVYSEIIMAMRKHFNVEGVVWNKINGNNLLNVHARAHTYPSKDYQTIAHPASIKILCNVCFQLTYKRIRIIPTDRRIPSDAYYEISVLPSRGETLESVTSDLGILSFRVTH